MGPGSFSIRPCLSRRDFRAFENCAESLHGHRPEFVPPFPGSVSKFFSDRSPFLQKHGQIFGYLAERCGRAVGRIAAIHNQTHNRIYSDRTGFFGFFECIDDPEVSGHLIEAAEEKLRSLGLDSMRGPYNPTINDECGLLVDGFEKPPSIGLTWNPPYYAGLIGRSGLEPFTSMTSFALPLAELGAPGRLKPIAERARARSKLVLRPMDLRRLDRELPIVREVYNATLERNTGAIPITMEDLLSGAEEFRLIAYPITLLIAEKEGENAGVALSLPDINRLLIALKRTPRWLRPLHFLWLLKTRRLRQGRQVVYGIAPKFRDRSLHGWMTYEHFLHAQSVFDFAELGWVEDNNHEIIRTCELIGGTPLRKWRIYQKPL